MRRLNASLCLLFCFAVWGKSISLLPYDSLALPAHLDLSGHMKIYYTHDVTGTVFTLLAPLRPCVSCQGRRMSLPVPQTGGLCLGWHPLMTFSALTTILGIWNVYWHFLKPFKIFMGDSHLFFFFKPATMIMQTQTFRSPKQDSLTVYPMLIYLHLFYYFKSNYFQARHWILSN